LKVTSKVVRNVSTFLAAALFKPFRERKYVLLSPLVLPFVTQEAFVYYTTDGLDPIGYKGKATQGSALAMQKNIVEWNMPEWGYVQVYTTTNPAQRSGTVVLYRLSSLNPAGERSLRMMENIMRSAWMSIKPRNGRKRPFCYHIMVGPLLSRFWKVLDFPPRMLKIFTAAHIRGDH
jgi:hypothetical protein